MSSRTPYKKTNNPAARRRAAARQRKPLATQAPTRLIVLNKPYDVLTQFTDDQGRKTLKDYVPIAGVYAAGRLDRNSEGLLLLTNDGRLQAHIAEPKYKMTKTYLVQVDGAATAFQVQQLCQGVELNDGMTLPAKAEIIPEPDLWPRNPPIRVRATIPTTWLRISITEGRNRQVRRMTAAVGLPTLRLVRTQIGPWALGGLQPGQWREVSASFSE